MPSEKIGEKILRGEANSNTADSPECEHARYFIPQSLQPNQRRRDDDRQSQELGNRVRRGLINLLTGTTLVFQIRSFAPRNKAHQKPGDATDDVNIA